MSSQLFAIKAQPTNKPVTSGALKTFYKVAQSIFAAALLFSLTGLLFLISGVLRLW